MRRCGTLDPDGQAEIVVNLQGDFPDASRRTTSAPCCRRSTTPPSTSRRWPSQIHTEEEAPTPNVVKAVGSPIGASRLRALYFTRATAPIGDGPRYHHIGLYAYRRAALERFVTLPPSPLEQQEKLEQLRALEAGMRIDITIVDTRPARRRHPGRPRNRPAAYWQKPEPLLQGPP